MKKHTGYIVLFVAGSIYIAFNFVITSYVLSLDPELTFYFSHTFFAEVIAFIPISFLFIAIRYLFIRKRELFNINSYQTVGVHLLILTIFILVHSFWQVYFNSILLGADFDIEYIQRDILIFLNIRVLIYIIAIALVVGVVKVEERENKLLEQSQLKLQLQKTSFRELELKLNPSVIYPNFDFIKTHVQDRPDDASKLVLNLSQQLRILIDNLDEDRIPLHKDIQFFEHYFKALQLRLERELLIQTDVDSDLLNSKIPSMVLLVPLLEELFFGRYSIYVQSVDCALYRSERTRLGFIHLIIDLSPVSVENIFEEKIQSDIKLTEINSHLESFKESSLAIDLLGNNLRFNLKMNLA